MQGFRQTEPRALTNMPPPVLSLVLLQLLSSLSVRLGVFGNMSENCALGISEQVRGSLLNLAHMSTSLLTYLCLPYPCRQVEHLFQRNPKFSILSPSMQQPLARIVQVRGEAGSTALAVERERGPSRWVS